MPGAGLARAVRAGLKSLLLAPMRALARRFPRLRGWLRQGLDTGSLPFHDDGHFYSPVVDIVQARAERARIWPDAPPPVLGIDFDEAGQRRRLEELLGAHLEGFDYPDQAPAGAVAGYHDGNGQFDGLDARLLFAMLRRHRPPRIVEVGSGYSSLLMADVNRRFLAGQARITCIEPFPRPFLRAADAGLRLLAQPVQAVAMAEFAALAAGDLLFIDSSHVAKTGSDVNHLYFEVLPRLAPGVLLHVHDIFLPDEYPPDWVLEDRRSWNEQYLLRALLMDSGAWRVELGAHYAATRLGDTLADLLRRQGQPPCRGASFWLRKAAPPA